MSPIEISWTVTGIIVPVLIGTGYTCAGFAPPESKRARFCFYLSALILGGMEIVWYSQTGYSFWLRVSIASLVCLVIGIGLPETLRWVERRESLWNPPKVDSKTEALSPPVTQQPALKLVATGTSEIVARVFMRGLFPQPPATSAEYKPLFQEFFYDWLLVLVPEGPTGEILITLKEPKKHTDSIKIAPDIAVVSGPAGKWMSGFQEPGRKNPDFYETTIRFSDGLEQDRPARIVFRRPLKLKNGATKFTPSDFLRTMDINAGKVEVEKKYYEEVKQFELISLQLKTLIEWKYSGTKSAPVPIRKDPNVPLPPLGRGEIETTLEVRCQDPACQKITVQQMEARKKDF